MAPQTRSHDERIVRGPARWVLVSLGVILTALATVGAFLPVLPTTPFLLLAAACFARTSSSLHRRLLANRVFGPYIVQWQHDRTIPPEAKRKAYGAVVVTFALSIFLVEVTWLRWTLLSVCVALLALLRLWPSTQRAGRLRSIPQPDSEPPQSSD